MIPELLLLRAGDPKSLVAKSLKRSCDIVSSDQSLEARFPENFISITVV